MSTARAASEPKGTATFEGSLLELFQAITNKLRTGDLEFTISGTPVTLSAPHGKKLVFRVGDVQVGFAQLYSERYTREQIERLGEKGQHYVFIARSSAPDTVMPRANAQLENYKLPANTKPSDLLRRIVLEFTQLCKEHPLRQQVKAAAEPGLQLHGLELLEAWKAKLVEACRRHEGLVVARHGKFAVHLKNEPIILMRTYKYIQFNMYTTYNNRVIDTRWHGSTFPLPEITLRLKESDNTQRLSVETCIQSIFVAVKIKDMSTSVPAPSPHDFMKVWIAVLQRQVHEMFDGVDPRTIMLMPESAEAAAEPQAPAGSEAAVFAKLFDALRKKPNKELKLPDVKYVHARTYGSREGDSFTYSMRLEADEMHNFVLVHLKLLESSVELPEVSRKAVGDLTAVIRNIHGGAGCVMELPRPDGSESIVPVRLQNSSLSGIAASVTAATLKILDRHVWRYVKSSWAAAAAEPHPGFDNSTDVVASIANKFGTLVLRPQLDLRNILNNDIVWETPVKVRYGNCNLHVIALGVSGDCLFFVEQTNDGLVRRRAFELHEPTHQDQHQHINLRQLTNSAEAPDIKGADDNGSFSVDVDRNDPLNGTFRALALKAMRLVQTAEMSNADTLTGLRTAVQAAGGVLERDGVRVTRNPGNKRGLHVAFKLEDGTWTRVESIGLNTQGSLTFSTPAHIHHLSVGRSPDKLMSDMAMIWKQEQQAHASVFAAAEPAPVTDFVAAIARHPGNRYRREIDGVLVVIGGSGGSGPAVRALVTDEKMPSAGNPNAAYNVVFDPTSETYQVSTSWDKQQRPFSKIPARSITGIDKLVDTIAVVVGRHASRVVFPRRRARARKNSL